jgi:hypothetical protein
LSPFVEKRSLRLKPLGKDSLEVGFSSHGRI